MLRLALVAIVVFMLGCSGDGGSSGAETVPIVDNENNFLDEIEDIPVVDVIEEVPVVDEEESNVSTGTDYEDISWGEYSQSNLSVANEPYINEQWSIYGDDRFYRRNAIDANAHINAGALLDRFRGRGVNVAIIDDGLDVTHEDLQGAIYDTFDLATLGKNVAHSRSIEYHGTAVSGILAARVNAKGIAGVASSSRIYFLKYKEYMSDSEMIELFERAANAGADIINNSWGTGNASPALRMKLVDLANNARGGKGICIVFAAGNENEEMAGDESDIAEVISVGATNKNNERVSYANYGHNLDIMAPGGEYLGITTLDVRGSNGGSVGDYLLYNDSNGFVGTSAAAPIVSGIIALMLEKNPNLTRVEIENILKNTADKIGGVSYDGSGHNDYYGHGKVNLTRILESVSL